MRASSATTAATANPITTDDGIIAPARGSDPMGHGAEFPAYPISPTHHCKSRPRPVAGARCNNCAGREWHVVKAGTARKDQFSRPKIGLPAKEC